MKPTEKQNFPKKSGTIKYTVIACIIVLLSLYQQYKGEIYRQVDDWKLIPRPERFTELYFENHINLPKQIQKGDQAVFSFTIHNLEGKSWEYSYVVYFKSLDGQVTEIEDNSVTLRDGEAKTIDETYTSETDNNRGAVFVEIKNPEQGIHFLLNYSD